MTEEKPIQAKTTPLIHGAIWDIGRKPYTDWSKSDFETEIEAQKNIGFDLLWLLGSSILLDYANDPDDGRDVLEIVYGIADEKGMRVIIDLIPKGGQLPLLLPVAQAIATAKGHINRLYACYGDHPSFYGWFLNNEINPLHPSEEEGSRYWRTMWRGVVDECHHIAPGSVVTISPFFLLDESELRGYKYLPPDEYAAWWKITLEETGIDILMLQDSGEHLAFYSIEQREPFWSAVAGACREADAKFWINVEMGEVDVSGWDEYLELERRTVAMGKGKDLSDGIIPWRFTPIEDLEKKLRLAVKYADNIIGWGYFPFMSKQVSAGNEYSGCEQAYQEYLVYRDRVVVNK